MITSRRPTAVSNCSAKGVGHADADTDHDTNRHDEGRFEYHLHNDRARTHTYRPEHAQLPYAFHYRSDKCVDEAKNKCTHHDEKPDENGGVREDKHGSSLWFEFLPVHYDKVGEQLSKYAFDAEISGCAAQFDRNLGQHFCVHHLLQSFQSREHEYFFEAGTIDIV